LSDHLVWFWTYTVLRVRLWWAMHNVKRAVAWIKTQPLEDVAHVITKWKWDASRCDDTMIREAMLDGIANLEKYLKWKDENRRAKN